MKIAGSIWNMLGDRHDRHVLLHGFKHLDRIRAHDEIDAARREQEPRVHLRAALLDRRRRGRSARKCRRRPPDRSRRARLARASWSRRSPCPAARAGRASRMAKKAMMSRSDIAARAPVKRAQHTRDFALRCRWIWRRSGTSPRASAGRRRCRRRPPRARCARFARARRSCRRVRRGAG